MCHTATSDHRHPAPIPQDQRSVSTSHFLRESICDGHPRPEPISESLQTPRARPRGLGPTYQLCPRRPWGLSERSPEQEELWVSKAAQAQGDHVSSHQPYWKQLIVDDRYLIGTDDYRRDSREFVEAQGLKLHRFDLSDEPVGLCAVTYASRLISIGTVYSDWSCSARRGSRRPPRFVQLPSVDPRRHGQIDLHISLFPHSSNARMEPDGDIRRGRYVCWSGRWSRRTRCRRGGKRGVQPPTSPTSCTDSSSSSRPLTLPLLPSVPPIAPPGSTKDDMKHSPETNPHLRMPRIPIVWPVS